jgi:putative protease
LGGRSANRGECAQACRMPYELISDGQTVALGDRRYLLSPQDLAGLEMLPELARLGVASLKIEGRLKSPEYVANITRVYRQALDNLAENATQARKPPEIESSARYEMEMAFSRGLFTGWFGGINNQKLVHARFGKKRGVYLGEVLRIERDGIVIGLEAPLKAGDGVVFDAGNPEQTEQGGRVYRVDTKGKSSPHEAHLSFGHEDVDLRKIHIADKVWKTSDPELDRELRQTYAGDSPRFQRPLTIEFHGAVGQPAILIGRDACGHVVEVESSVPLATAQNQPLTSERLVDQLGRLGGTPFRLEKLENFLSAGVILPVSELNRMRREAVSQLEILRSLPKRWQLQEAAATKAPLKSPIASVIPAHLIVMARKLEQLKAAIESGVRTLYCEFEDPKKYGQAVAMVRASATRQERPEIFVAPPRIFKTGEEWTLNQVRACEADGYLIRNYDHLRFFAKDRGIGDFSFNVANHLSADYFKNHFRLERVTASYDLNFSQLEALLQGAPASWFEVTIHQHMPMFHMEHCVFCAFLSQGTDYRNCGRPCDRHDLKLRDRVGAEHPIKADVGCRNTVFNSLAQTGAEYIERLLSLGARHFRIEFLNETPAQVRTTILKYQQLLRGEIKGQQLWRELKLMNQLGVTRGQMAGV